jgi:hypothetical protein
MSPWPDLALCYLCLSLVKTTFTMTIVDIAELQSVQSDFHSESTHQLMQNQLMLRAFTISSHSQIMFQVVVPLAGL